MLDIHLKGVTKVGRAEKSVDSNEQLPDVSGILLVKRRMVTSASIISPLLI